MKGTIASAVILLMAVVLACKSRAQPAEPLEGTYLLTLSGDLSAQMVAGIDRFLMREIERSVDRRKEFWARDFSSRQAFEKSVIPNRQRLARYLGIVDRRLPVTALQYVGNTRVGSRLADSDEYTVYAVRWPVWEGVLGEGLLLQPKRKITAQVVAIPDADQTPEMLVGLASGVSPQSQFARRLAENGVQVVIPVLIDRKDRWSGNSQIGRFTNQPHREWIYRQAYQMGRHIIGYEVQKVIAAIDWFGSLAGSLDLKIGVAGYGEGGLIAFYSAALDTRIEAALVSGYFGPRERLWEEPIYRNVWGLLLEFGDAEIASLISPRALIIEYSRAPAVDGPPAPQAGRAGAAPGKIITPTIDAVEQEIARVKTLIDPQSPQETILLVAGDSGQTVDLGSESALRSLLVKLGFSGELKTPGVPPLLLSEGIDSEERQHRQLDQLQEYTQKLLLLSEHSRDQFFWKKLPAQSSTNWVASTAEYRKELWEEVIGRFPAARLPINARTRKIYDRPNYTGYEVVLDVWPDVFAWGSLLIPKDLKPGERRPVVVCQHGLEGLPEHTINGPNEPGYGAYKAFAARLAERGFITFAPHNPYRGGDKFRVLQRKANPLKKSIFSIIVAQHDRILDWLAQAPFVDPQRMGFYGLSYGGKTAMRVPSLLDRYKLSICSADFNEWIKKNVTVHSPYSYMFTSEYEMPEFNLGQTFNYAEMAALIAPRPFMVERGHNDGVAPDEWVAYEFAKVRRLYAKLGIPQRTEIEFFDGPHTINGAGTFEFLHRHLEWPEPKAQP